MFAIMKKVTELFGRIHVREWDVRYLLTKKCTQTIPSFTHLHKQEPISRYVFLYPLVVLFIYRPDSFLVQKRFFVVENPVEIRLALEELQQLLINPFWFKAETPIYGFFHGAVPFIKVPFHEDDLCIRVLFHQSASK